MKAFSLTALPALVSLWTSAAAPSGVLVSEGQVPPGPAPDKASVDITDTTGIDISRVLVCGSELHEGTEYTAHVGVDLIEIDFLIPVASGETVRVEGTTPTVGQTTAPLHFHE